MKRNLDFLIILCVCLLVCGTVYIMCGSAGKSSLSHAGGGITFRETGAYIRSGNGYMPSNSDFSGGFMGGNVVSSSSLTSNISVSSPNYSHYQGLSLARSSGSSRSLLSNQVTHGSTGTGNINFAGSGASNNYSRRTTTAPAVQPAISMPVYAQSLKINTSPIAQVRSVSNAEIEVARRSYLPTSTTGSSAYSSAYTTSAYRPSVYGTTSLYRDGALAYGNSLTNGQSRAASQQRAPSSGLGNTWGNWLDKNWNDSWGGTKDDSGIGWFTETQAKEAYDDMIANWNSTMGNPPSWEDFLAWLQSGKGDYRMPLGDIMPLCLIALAYMVMMLLRRKH